MSPLRHAALLTLSLGAVSLAFMASLPGELVGQVSDRDAYLRTVSTHFQVAETEARILLEERMALEDLPVLLLVSRETGMASAAILAYRRGGATWMAVSRRFDMSPSRFHVDVPAGAAGPHLERAMRLFEDTPMGQWGTLDLTDDEVVGLVHVKVFSRYFQLPPQRVLEARQQSAGWIEVPGRLARP